MPEELDVNKYVARGTSASDIFGVDPHKYYRAMIEWDWLVVGGVPSDPSVIRNWLRARLELGDTALEELARATWAERHDPMTANEKIEAIMESGEAPSVNGFKRNRDGFLCIEARHVEAMLKEACNSAYPGKDFPSKKGVAPGFRKGLKSTMEERITIMERLIPLGVKEPTEEQERIKHVSVRQPDGTYRRTGIITKVEVVGKLEPDDPPARCTFTIKVRDDFISREMWGRIWTVGETIALGSDRARTDGRYHLISWEALPGNPYA